MASWVRARKKEMEIVDEPKIANSKMSTNGYGKPSRCLWRRAESQRACGACW